MLVNSACIYLVAKNISYHSDLDKYLPQWLEMMVDLTDSERGTIFLYDEKRDELWSRCIIGDFVSPLRIGRTTGIVGQVFESGQPHNVPVAYREMQFNPTVDRRTKFKTKSVLCWPIKLGEKIVAVVEFLNKKDGQTYSEQDEHLIRLMSPMIAPGCTPPSVHRSIRKHDATEQQMLTTAVQRDKNRLMSPLVREIVDTVRAILNTERCTLFLSDPLRSRLWAFVSQGLESIRIEIPDNRGIAGAVFTNNIMLNIPDAYEDPRFNKEVLTKILN